MMRDGGIPCSASCSIMALTERSDRNRNAPLNFIEHSWSSLCPVLQVLQGKLGWQVSFKSKCSTGYVIHMIKKASFCYAMYQWKLQLLPAYIQGKYKWNSLFSAAFLMPGSSSGASGLRPMRSNLDDLTDTKKKTKFSSLVKVLF